ncbi:hypothetical protein BG74_01835 [Sodalis-like endosymbiont of Proechinophthirus fluctus]|uniref:hypothetical protein n=1 Tax=Sodalis-like endosymbiont of Proechinophthirus fluctus TaxID=1462730 RepID=UPI0007A877F5|nr:hypothetical protein [Sodalis-like endosymbiont of Proechinophthirus fluctus]KYP97597.1 hypothetical protein BG74_01835 [Sodalis-like endosymbiont of Proechinophthirus fluctus]
MINCSDDGWHFAVRLGQKVKLALPKHDIRSYLAVSVGFDIGAAIAQHRYQSDDRPIGGKRRGRGCRLQGSTLAAHN